MAAKRTTKRTAKVAGQTTTYNVICKVTNESGSAATIEVDAYARKTKKDPLDAYGPASVPAGGSAKQEHRDRGKKTYIEASVNGGSRCALSTKGSAHAARIEVTYTKAGKIYILARDSRLKPVGNQTC